MEFFFCVIAGVVLGVWFSPRGVGNWWADVEHHYQKRNAERARQSVQPGANP